MITRSEFEGSLSKALEIWREKEKQEVETLLGPEVANTVGFNQRNPHHCHELFQHLLYTVESLPPQAELLLKVAAFLHDIAKPVVAREKQGRLVFYGHAQRSAELAEPILKQLGYDEQEIKEILFYIAHHDDFISWVLPYENYNHENPYLIPITSGNLQKHIHKISQKEQLAPLEAPRMWKNLLLLVFADGNAQADEVLKNGRIVDFKAHKREKALLLQTELLML